MYLLKKLVVLLICLHGLYAWAQTSTGPTNLSAAGGLPSEIQASLKSAGLPPDALYLYAKPVNIQPRAGSDDSSALGLLNQAQTPVNPASLTKLITTSIALDTLGQQFRWKTGFYVLQNPLNGQVNQLFIKGSGDPTLHTEELWLILRSLKELGLNNITGQLVLDRTAFPNPNPLPSVQIDSATYRAYHAEPDALLFNHGSTTVLINPQGKKKIQLDLIDAPAAWSVVSHIRSVGGPCVAWKDSLDVQWQYQPKVSVTVSGDYPSACGEQRLPIRMPNRNVMWRDWFAQMWAQLGGKFSGQVVEGVVPAQAQAFYTYESAALNDAVRDLNKFSNNVMAQNLALTLLSRAENFACQQNCWAELVARWAKTKRIDTQAWMLDSGSGLSRSTRMSAASLGAVLHSMSASPHFPALLASLPIAGQDGTLSNRMKAAPGIAYLKTGRLQDTAALAGYVKNQNGKLWVMVAILSHPKATASTRVLDEITEWVMRTP
jgi:D-alanyl-D-alanine carboxypeptidase/D-alanyl-D-alanine-endopeptidase (penicillin-binding protein 4)